jgi:hypothetical protein
MQVDEKYYRYPQHVHQAQPQQIVALYYDTQQQFYVNCWMHEQLQKLVQQNIAEQLRVQKIRFWAREVVLVRSMCALFTHLFREKSATNTFREEMSLILPKLILTFRSLNPTLSGLKTGGATKTWMHQLHNNRLSACKTLLKHLKQARAEFKSRTNTKHTNSHSLYVFLYEVTDTYVKRQSSTFPPLLCEIATMLFVLHANLESDKNLLADLTRTHHLLTSQQ